MSLEVAKVIAHVKEKTGDTYTNPEIATALAMICGIISAAIGILRIGFILEFIPGKPWNISPRLASLLIILLAPAVAGFMTGSAFTIASGQVPALLGISKRFNTRESAYKVVIHTLQNLKHTNLDAAFGLTALFGLYFIRWALNTCEKRYPKYRRYFFFANVMRYVPLYSTFLFQFDPNNSVEMALLSSLSHWHPIWLRETMTQNTTGLTF